MELVGESDIAERLRLNRPLHVHWYLQHDDTFPEPIARIGRAERPPWCGIWPTCGPGRRPDGLKGSDSRKFGTRLSPYHSWSCWGTIRLGRGRGEVAVRRVLPRAFGGRGRLGFPPERGGFLLGG